MILKMFDSRFKEKRTHHHQIIENIDDYDYYIQEEEADLIWLHSRIRIAKVSIAKNNVNKESNKGPRDSRIIENNAQRRKFIEHLDEFQRFVAEKEADFVSLKVKIQNAKKAPLKGIDCELNLKRKPGRPKKEKPIQVPVKLDLQVDAIKVEKRKPGRPKKVKPIHDAGEMIPVKLDRQAEDVVKVEKRKQASPKKKKPIQVEDAKVEVKVKQGKASTSAKHVDSDSPDEVEDDHPTDSDSEDESLIELSDLDE